MFKNPARLQRMVAEGFTTIEVLRFFQITRPTFEKYIAMPCEEAIALEKKLVDRFGDEFEGTLPAKQEKKTTKATLKAIEIEAAKAKRKQDQLDLSNEYASHYKAGKTLQEVAEIYGVTRQRVQQVLKRVGCNWETSGRLQRSIDAEESRRNKAKEHLASQIAKRWGCSVEEWKKGKSNGNIQRFVTQRKNAKHRGIEWNFTYKQWIDWWAETGNIDNRGRGKELFCMSRLNDTGPYSPENVVCKTICENSREAFTRKPTKPIWQRGVFNILKGTNKPYLAKFGGTKIGYFATVEEAVEARTSYIKENNVIPRGAAVGSGKWYSISKNGYIRMQFLGFRKSCKTVDEAVALRQKYLSEYLQGATSTHQEANA